jgi:hypothetical protein
MSDHDTAIERITEKAQRLWPDAKVVEDEGSGAVSVCADYDEDGWSVERLRVEHPRALEALEAALDVLLRDEVKP